ncbi:hypothetical protein ASF28_08940 [Methylobacterium sp. Leaf99]|nr:hypothetical protein ASF28_08940 [Methylobacterium sp. Leaf99]
MERLMRKHVTPADPTATIPDPERGCDLPADGLPVTWSAYWAAREARGEVVVTDPADAAPEEADEVPAPEPAPAPPARSKAA